MFDDLLEVAGLGCLVGFGYMVWPPAALLLLGLVLVVVGNVRAGRRRRARAGAADPAAPVPVLERLVRAVAAYYRGVL